MMMNTNDQPVAPLAGRCGVILGVANERSIAWSIARAAHAAGARLAFNYQNQRLAESVQELAATLDGTPDTSGPAAGAGSICLPCDLTHDEEIDRFFSQVGEQMGGRLDFLVHSVAFARKEELAGRYLNTTRGGFALALEVSAYSLVAAARRAEPLMKAAGGGSILTLTYLGSERVIPNYNVMGVAKAALEASVRYLAADLGPESIRVNAISAGPIRTLAAHAITGFGDMLKTFAERAPLRRNTDPEEVAATAVFLLSDAARGITGETLYVDAGYHIMGM
jgi:enoyl-[acyl-carrier protein] reductase I